MIVSAPRIITGDGKTLLRGYGVLMGGGGVIEAVAPVEELAAARPWEQRVDCPQGTLIPGLIDLHAHLSHSMSGLETALQSDYTQAYLVMEHCKRAFRRGVTTVRSLCSRPGLEQAVQYAARQGIFHAPNLISSGRGICMTGGHGHNLGPGVEEVDGVENLRQAVRRRVREGHRWIKVLTSHREEIEEFTQAELDALADEGHRLGCRLAVHAGTRLAVEMCIHAGFDTIEHGTFMTVEQAGRMRERGMVWVPTIIAYSSLYQEMRPRDGESASPAVRYFQRADEAYQSHFRAIAETGVSIGAGTDYVTGGFTDLDLPRELRYYVEYGMDVLTAIGCATGAGADALGLTGVTGRIEPGLNADLVLLDGDPTEDSAALSRIRRVFLQGETVYAREE